MTYEVHLDERWRPVVGFDDLYEVSNMGRVRSRRRMLKPFLSLKGGYPQVTLSRVGKKYLRNSHKLVAAAFIGPCPRGQEVRHRDGNASNPRLDNLRYGTRAENEADKVLHNKSNRGERHGMAKLTNADVSEIRSLVELNISQRAIADQFGIHQSSVSKIAKGGRWANARI